MAGKRKQYTPEFKFKVVLESLQRDTTLEEVCRKYSVSSSMSVAWPTNMCLCTLCYTENKIDSGEKALLPPASRTLIPPQSSMPDTIYMRD